MSDMTVNEIANNFLVSLSDDTKKYKYVNAVIKNGKQVRRRHLRNYNRVVKDGISLNELFINNINKNNLIIKKLNEKNLYA